MLRPMLERRSTPTAGTTTPTTRYMANLRSTIRQRSTSIPSAWFNEDHLVLGSAGNYSRKKGRPERPRMRSGLPRATLGQVSLSFGDGNPGPTADGRRTPPTWRRQGAESTRQNSTRHAKPGISAACATSFATPHAAGAAALVRQYSWKAGIPRVRAALRMPLRLLVRCSRRCWSAASINMTGAHSYPNNLSGWGLIRLDNVLFFEGGVHRVQIWDTRNGERPYDGRDADIVISVADGTRPLKVALVWTEPPAALGARQDPDQQS